jgi:hypothetical protein
MTEAEWLAATDPMQALNAADPKVNYRKRRLLTSALCRSVWDQMPDDCRAAVDQSDLFADGLLSRSALDAATSVLWDRLRPGPTLPPDWNAYLAAAYTASAPSAPDHVFEAVRKLEPGQVATGSTMRLIGCLFGNPFRPVAVEPDWLTSTVVALARGIYEERAFDRLPILADALQDAGCEHPDILTHCRGDGPHVRGCWIVDLLLGKT